MSLLTTTLSMTKPGMWSGFLRHARAAATSSDTRSSTSLYGTMQGKRCFPEAAWLRFDDPSVGRALKEHLPAPLGHVKAVPISAYSIMLRSNCGITIFMSQFPLGSILCADNPQGTGDDSPAGRCRPDVALTALTSLTGMLLVKPSSTLPSSKPSAKPAPRPQPQMCGNRRQRSP